MAWLQPRRYAAELETETVRLAAAASRRPPADMVPACPEWTVRDLVTHVGTGHRYAAGVIGQAATGPVPYRLHEAPADQAAWAGWLADGARLLIGAVEDRGFDGRAWTFQPAHQSAGFWLRRMVHDEIIHRFDLEPDGDLAADLAADGIADLLLVFTAVAGPGSPNPLLRQLTGTGETLLFRATDTTGHWHVTLGPDGPAWQAAEAPADVVCAAPVLELLLILNRRRAPGADAVHGDRALLDRWLDLTRF
ncbi:maleylpyruvate isomerase family mycothiol-dependent enzyme [Actinoplanes xinjiangensis]|uniref:maleylpyruvate isomerase family mycothiol-dependent enzyme n=1 Tax=Actinoplanes xinjiangensis TaxID=512350 RepID=UPI00342EBF2E